MKEFTQEFDIEITGLLNLEKISNELLALFCKALIKGIDD